MFVSSNFTRQRQYCRVIIGRYMGSEDRIQMLSSSRTSTSYGHKLIMLIATSRLVGNHLSALTTLSAPTPLSHSARLPSYEAWKTLAAACIHVYRCIQVLDERPRFGLYIEILYFFYFFLQAGHLSLRRDGGTKSSIAGQSRRNRDVWHVWLWSIEIPSFSK